MAVGSWIRVSVIIAAYNAERHIGRAIESALAQTERNLEIIVIDDCSDDGTPDVVRAYARRDSRVRLMVAPTNGGPGFARQLGVDAARGQWISILDADDAFLPERLSKLLAAADAVSADLVADNITCRDAYSGSIIGPMMPDGWISEPHVLSLIEFVQGNIGTRNRQRIAYGFLKPLINRAFLTNHSISYEISRFSEDFLIDLDLLVAGATWLLVPESYYIYDISPQSLTVNFKRKDMQALIYSEQKRVMTARRTRSQEEVSMLERHLLSVENAQVWTIFCDELKAKNFHAAWRAYISNCCSFLHINKELALHIPRLMERTVRLMTSKENNY